MNELEKEKEDKSKKKTWERGLKKTKKQRSHY